MSFANKTFTGSVKEFTEILKHKDITIERKSGYDYDENEEFKLDISYHLDPINISLYKKSLFGTYDDEDHEYNVEVNGDEYETDNALFDAAEREFEKRHGALAHQAADLLKRSKHEIDYSIIKNGDDNEDYDADDYDEESDVPEYDDNEDDSQLTFDVKFEDTDEKTGIYDIELDRFLLEASEPKYMISICANERPEIELFIEDGSIFNRIAAEHKEMQTKKINSNLRKK